MSWQDTARKNIFGKKENMCWYCDNATGGCPWADDFEPVPGWDAEADVMSGYGDKATYRIYNCPLFKRTEDKEGSLGGTDEKYKEKRPWRAPWKKGETES